MTPVRHKCCKYFLMCIEFRLLRPEITDELEAYGFLEP